MEEKAIDKVALRFRSYARRRSLFVDCVRVDCGVPLGSQTSCTCSGLKSVFSVWSAMIVFISSLDGNARAGAGAWWTGGTQCWWCPQPHPVLVVSPGDVGCRALVWCVLYGTWLTYFQFNFNTVYFKMQLHMLNTEGRAKETEPKREQLANSSRPCVLATSLPLHADSRD